MSGATNYHVAVRKAPWDSGPVVVDEGYIHDTIYAIPAGILEAGASYRWNVRAFNDVGGSSWSSRLYFQTASPQAAPSAPSATSPGYASEPGPETSLTPTLQWNAVAGATEYRVSLRQAPFPSGPLLLNGVSTTQMSYPVSSGLLEEGASYRWNVMAANDAGTSASSNTLYFHTERISASSNTKPSPPLSLSATAGNAEVRLSWSAPTSDGGVAITNYKVYRGSSRYGPVNLVATLDNVTTWVDASAQAGPTYFYYASAVNSAGESNLSNEAYATPYSASEMTQSTAAWSTTRPLPSTIPPVTYSSWPTISPNDPAIWTAIKLATVNRNLAVDDLRDIRIAMLMAVHMESGGLESPWPNENCNRDEPYCSASGIGRGPYQIGISSGNPCDTITSEADARDETKATKCMLEARFVLAVEAVTDYTNYVGPRGLFTGNPQCLVGASRPPPERANQPENYYATIACAAERPAAMYPDTRIEEAWHAIMPFIQAELSPPTNPGNPTPAADLPPLPGLTMALAVLALAGMRRRVGG